LKLGQDYPVLACTLGNITTTQLKNNINHIYSILYKAKIYYDRKNHIYSLKSEVVVSATPPYYCVFVSDHTSGSIHDFEIMKKIYHCYFEYLGELSIYLLYFVIYIIGHTSISIMISLLHVV
jgi:hypothetical protein